jgi:isopentenyl-diphosphate Delta-isomerase
MIAAGRRLQEEMGFVTPITKVFDFVYKAEFDNGLTEHEFDHVFTGVYEGEIKMNKEEVSDYSYVSIASIAKSLQTHPQKFTAWFHLAFPEIEKWWNKNYKNKVA